MNEPKIISRDREPMANGERLRVRLGGEDYLVIISSYEIEPGDERQHISVSRRRDAGTDEVPRWREFVSIIHAVAPDRYFAIPVPPADQWMNITPTVLHVQETRDEPLIEQWRRQADAVRGTRAAVRT